MQMLAVVLRALGRASNSTYRTFAADWAASARSAEGRRALGRRFDYDFAARPVDFAMPTALAHRSAAQDRHERPWLPVRRLPARAQGHRTRRRNRARQLTAPAPIVGSRPWRWLVRLMAREILRRAIYPGSTSLISLVYGNMLTHGRLVRRARSIHPALLCGRQPMHRASWPLDARVPCRAAGSGAH